MNALFAPPTYDEKQAFAARHFTCLLYTSNPDDFGTAVVHGATANDNAFGEFPNCMLEFLPVQCQHCDNPPCLSVCPTGATKKRADGIVYVDNSLCIGCRACMMACPYDHVRSINEGAPEYYLDVVVGEADAPTVSYTPLDVYKRQVL